MADQEKKALDLENLDVVELEDTALEGVAGGNETEPIDDGGGTGVTPNNCPVYNFAPHCGVKAT